MDRKLFSVAEFLGSSGFSAHFFYLLRRLSISATEMVDVVMTMMMVVDGGGCDLTLYSIV